MCDRGWLTDNNICAAQMLLLQFFPNMAGLQPPVLQKVCAFQVHSGEFLQIVHVGNNHWCVVSMVGCESGAVYVYDSLYKSPTKELIHLIARMIHSQSNELKITMMDVEKQSNGLDCGVLAIAYAFDLCSGFDPCSARFDDSGIRLHLATCLKNLLTSGVRVCELSSVSAPHTPVCLCTCTCVRTCNACLQCVVARSRCSTLRGSFSVCILCMSQKELLLGVVAPHSEVLLVKGHWEL